MLRKSFLMIFMGFVFLTVASEGQALTPRSCFDLIGVGYGYNWSRQHSVSHLGKFMIFFGPVGVGTAIFEHNDFWQIKNGLVQRADSNFIWRISTTEDNFSYFPVIIHYMPYIKRLKFGNLSLHSYLKYSLWTSARYYDSEMAGELYTEFKSEHFYNYFYRVNKHPSSEADVGICLLLNLWRFVSFWLNLGIQRLDYAYHIPESFKKAKVPVPNPVETRFYISYGLSIGYWGIK